MIGIIALRNNFVMRRALRSEGVVHTYQDNFLKPHVECELHGDISYGRAGPERSLHIQCKDLRGASALNKNRIAEKVRIQVFSEGPRQEFDGRRGQNLLGTLLQYQPVNSYQECG